EHRDASDAEKKIAEINTGFIAARADFLFSALAEITPANAQKELYLTDIVGIAAKRGTPAAARLADDATELEGINDRVQLAAQETALFKRVARAHMLEGVTILHPGSVRIDPRAKIGADTVIHPRVELRGAVVLGRECVVDTGSVIQDSTLGDGVTVKPYCVIDKARAANGCIIGPFANLRPEAELAEGVHIGNFVEVKKSTIGKGSKANHLAYLGDATIGAGVNVGAGTTVTEDVAPGALALTRPEQKQVAGFAARFRAKGEKAKAAKKKEGA
ncbi:MAG TPA: bifunctional UDP-N-acetylglucosamine diphosphorylase/glucosamine-1-phosphate N-acetyltransferase GlmU, partial [bacterium]|nr:bifunctional UDP-N-acetylglucosamine diphosphorylase/glucosamine-1-phosphate N-acetyltransferase GlmU [bacterium]